MNSSLADALYALQSSSKADERTDVINQRHPHQAGDFVERNQHRVIDTLVLSLDPSEGSNR
jgi:hypothetical protein